MAIVVRRNRTAAGQFASTVRKELKARGWSRRQLARAMSPGNPEPARRSLNRWLSGQHMPTSASRRAVAVALGLPANTFDSDDDEDDSELGMALVHAIRELVRQETA